MKSFLIGTSDSEIKHIFAKHTMGKLVIISNLKFNFIVSVLL